MKKPYLKKHGEIAGFVIWIVNGKYIREKIDEEFTNFGQHYHFLYIPEKEFWIDKEYGDGDEIDYYVSNLLTENRLMAQGKSYHEAGEIGDRIEQRERKKHELIIKEIEKKKHERDVIQRIHKKLLKKYSKKVKVWLVNGRLVRDLFFIDFTEGGHDKVYPFIPEDEIWIDDDVNPYERKFVLLHEMHERNLMEKGYPYDLSDKRGIISTGDKKAKLHKSAHQDSSRIEHFCRLHPEETENKLKKEVR